MKEIQPEQIWDAEKKEGIKKLIQKQKLIDMMEQDEQLGLYQETPEEAANKLLWKKYPYHPPKDAGYWRDMFIEGAKWQQERTCNHNYILTSEQSIRIIKCLKCNNVQPI